jgi:uncharacterized cupin superfamily protein
LDLPSTPYLVRTSDPELKGEPGSHPLDPKVFRYRLNLGDKCGLTQGGVHINTIPPNNISTVPHWHSHEDEWFYIIKAGEGARILLYEDGESEPRDEEVKTGDFFGFPAGKKLAHAFKTGADEMVYLVGGSRKDVEVCHYPVIKTKGVIDRGGRIYWGVKEEHIFVPEFPAAPKK